MKPDFLHFHFDCQMQIQMQPQRSDESLSASGARTDAQVSNVLSVMKCKGPDSYELLNHSICSFLSSVIPFFSPAGRFIVSNPGSVQARK